MKHSAETLLDAALLDDASQNACLDIVRRAARRRRWTRRVVPGAAFVALLWIGALALHNRRPAETVIPAPRATPDYLVTSAALPAGLVVRTEATAGIVVSTSARGIEVVSTRGASPPEQIDDEALMQIAPGAVLVRHAAGNAQLMFPVQEMTEPESRAEIE